MSCVNEYLVKIVFKFEEFSDIADMAESDDCYVS